MRIGKAVLKKDLNFDKLKHDVHYNIVGGYATTNNSIYVEVHLEEELITLAPIEYFDFVDTSESTGNWSVSYLLPYQPATANQYRPLLGGVGGYDASQEQRTIHAITVYDSIIVVPDSMCSNAVHVYNPNGYTKIGLPGVVSYVSKLFNPQQLINLRSVTPISFNEEDEDEE